MPRKTLRSIIPTAARVREIRALEILGDWIYQENLWHINRYSASMACFVGLFVAFLPVPGQMFLAAALAILFRCNLPLSVALVWITNPVTMAGIYFIAYKIGALITNSPVRPWNFELSFHWLSTSMLAFWKPFLVGCLVCGLFCGSLGFFVMSQVWRLRVSYLWRRRKRLRAGRQ